MRTPTIQEIAQNTRETGPHFFSRDTLKFFGQTMSSFKVWKGPSGDYYIAAPSYWWDRELGRNKLMGVSFRRLDGNTLVPINHDFKSMKDAKEWVKTNG